MHKALVLLILLACSPISSNSQVGVISGIMGGEDSEKFDFSSAYGFKFSFPVYNRLFPEDDPVMWLRISPGIQFEGYNYKKPLMPKRREGKTEFVLDEDPDHIYKDECLKTSNRMSFSYLNLKVDPFLFVPLGQDIDPLLVSPGIFAEYQIGGRFKRRYYVDGDEQVIKRPYRDDSDYMDLKRFQYGIQAEVKWKFLTVFYNYYFTPLFKRGEGPRLVKSRYGLFFHFFGGGPHY